MPAGARFEVYFFGHGAVMTARVPHIFGFYAILTKPLRGYEYCTKLCVDHDVAFVQLRMKDMPKEDVLRTAERLKAITAGTSTKLIINDDPWVATRSRADGVHVGQSDLPYAEARKIVGEKAIVGVSTHNRRQTSAARALRPDYIGIGPVFATPTKKIADPPIGIEGMKAMLRLASVPAVALGSITTRNLPEILEAGARNFAMVRPVNQSREPQKVLREITRIYRAFITG